MNWINQWIAYQTIEWIFAWSSQRICFIQPNVVSCPRFGRTKQITEPSKFCLILPNYCWLHYTQKNILIFWPNFGQFIDNYLYFWLWNPHYTHKNSSPRIIWTDSKVLKMLLNSRHSYMKVDYTQFLNLFLQ